MSDQPTGIQLGAKQVIWFILTTIFPLVVELDGTQSRGTWGTQLLSVAPGAHQLSVSWTLYWFLPVQKATLSVTVEPGQVVAVSYKVRWFFLLPGRLSLDAAS